MLIAGTQLASIGDLSVEDEPDRVAAVIIGLVLSITAIAAVVALALKVLRPVEMTLDEVIADPKLAPKINARTWLLGGVGSLEELRQNLATSAMPEADRESWVHVADEVVAYAAYIRTRETFEGTWRPLLGAGIAGVIGITAFTWGANPPEGSSKDAPLEPAPVSVEISLTAEGRAALADALGGSRCATGQIAALAIGGTATKPKVVTVARSGCKPAQFALPPEWGAATRPG